MNLQNLNENKFTSPQVPTGQTEFCSQRRKSRQRKPSSVLIIGSSDRANQVQFSWSEIPTGQTKFSPHRRKSRWRKLSLIVIVGASILLVSTLSISIKLQNLYYGSSFIYYKHERDSCTKGFYFLSWILLHLFFSYHSSHPFLSFS